MKQIGTCKECKWFDDALWVIGQKSKHIDKTVPKFVADGYGDCMRSDFEGGGDLGYAKLVCIASKKNGKAHMLYHESYGCINWEAKNVD